jgi:RNA polymerase sigma-70 factor (ECF subfamily)
MGESTEDPKARFAQWVEPLMGRAAGYAYSLVRNRADAEDALQEALLKGYLGVRAYDRARPFKGWWFAVLRNCCLDLLRRRKARAALPLESAAEVEARGDGGGEAEGLLSALAKLTPPQREVLELRYFGDCSYREIAEALGVAEGTVMSRLHAARQALAAVYRRDEA